MQIDFLIKTFEENKNKDALLWRDEICTYKNLLKEVKYWKEHLKKNKIQPGTVVGLEGDFSPNTIAILLCLIEMNCIIVPLDYSQHKKNQKKYTVAKLDCDCKKFVTN